MREKIAQHLRKAKFFISNHSLYLSIGLFSVLLGGLFVTVYQVSQQQETRSMAQAGLIPHENCSASKEQVNLDVDEKKLFNLVNQYRKDNDLEALIADEPLNRGAAWLAKDMADANKLSHTDSLGRNPGERIVDCGFYGEENQVLENIAKGQTTPEDVFNGWKKSKVHNETMLNEQMVYGGIGRREVKSTSKNKNSKQSGYYWVMNFTAQPDVDNEDSDDEEECYYYEDDTESASDGDALIAANNKNKNNNNKKNNNGSNKNNNGSGNGGAGSNKNDKKDNNGGKSDKKNDGGKNDKNNNGGKGNNNGGNKKNDNNNDKKKKKKKKKKNKDNNTNTDEEEVGEELEEGDEDLPPCDDVVDDDDDIVEEEDTDNDGTPDEVDQDDDGDGVLDEDEEDSEEDEEQPQVTEPVVPSMQFAVNIPGSVDLDDIRELTVDFTDLNNQVVATNKINIQGFSDDMYIGFMEYGTLPSGVYKIRVKLPNSLRQTIEPQYQKIDKTQDIDLPEVTLVMGDFDNNNILNILDFNIFKNCMDVTLFEEEEDDIEFAEEEYVEEETYEEEDIDADEESDDSETFAKGFRILNTQCSQHDLTDLNGDGVVDVLDYDLLLNNFQTLRSN